MLPQFETTSAYRLKLFNFKEVIFCSQEGISFLRKYNFFISLLISVVIGAYYFLSEKIQYGNGLGMDGSLYGAIAKDFYSYINIRGVHGLNRIFPSFFVHHLLLFLPDKITTQSVIYGFIAMNTLCTSIVVYLWNKIADELDISFLGRIVGLSALFMNYSVLKWIGYYPVLTDQVAFCLGGCVLYFYLKNQPLGLIVCLIIGLFTWPTINTMSLILILFPRQDKEKQQSIQEIYYNNFQDYAFYIRGATIFLFVYIYYVLVYCSWSPISIYPKNFVGYCFLFFYMAYGMSHLIKNLSWPSLIIAVKRIFRNKAFWIAFLIYIPINYYQRKRGVPNEGNVLITMVRHALMDPRLGYYFFFNVVLLTPLFAWTLLRWKFVAQTIAKFGIGATLVFVSIMVLTFALEARSSITSLPFIVAFTIKSLDDQVSLSWKNVGVFLILSLWFSRVWMRFGKLSGNSMLYPDNYFYSHLGGYWVDYNFYWIHLGCALMSAWILWNNFKIQTINVK